jgi:hypothetical protein
MTGYTVIVVDGEYAEAMRYNHKPVTFTNDIDRALVCDLSSESDILELEKITSRLKKDRISYWFMEVY